MGRAYLNGPPDCPSPRGWCVICLMRAKQKQWEMTEDERRQIYEAPGDVVKFFEWPQVLTREMRPGDYRGVCGDAPMLGIVDGLCWDDVAGMDPTDAAVPTLLRSNGPLPPGLQRKRGG